MTALHPDVRPADALTLDADAQDLLFREARTANTFAADPVSDEQLRAIYDLVKFGPTAMNSQPMRLLAVRTPEARERLLKHMSEGNRAKTAAAPLSLVVTADTGFHEHLPTMFPHAAGARDAMEANPGRAGMARFNAAIQLGYLIVGIRAAGLAAGPMAGFDAEGLRREFLEGTGQEVLAVVNVGRPGPDAWFPRNPRHGFDQVVTEV